MKRQAIPNLSSRVQSQYIQVGDVRTHYLEALPTDAEARRRTPIVLVHSGEFGGRAELSWRDNIAELGKHFPVYAPDMVGFGRTELLHSFSDPLAFRIGHLRRFLEALRVGPAHFVGNSFGGGLVLQLAAQEELGFQVRSVVAVSGGGEAPDNDARKILTGYNGRRDEMREILRVLFFDERWWREDIVDERWRASREPGVWEACAAARLAPEGERRGFKPERPDYGKIRVPALIVAGAQDLLRLPSYPEEMRRQIPGARVEVFDRSRHCSHIECAEAFNRLVVQFFIAQG